MDKETLSNYGWVVIATLVLVVMIALATPFGNFIADAVKSTVQGLFDVNNNALFASDIIVEDQDIDDYMPNIMNNLGFYYDKEYLWVYSEDGSSNYQGISMIFKENGTIQIKGENVAIDDILPEDLEYSYQQIVGKNSQQDVEFIFSSDGKTLTYKYRETPDQFFGLVE